MLLYKTEKMNSQISKVNIRFDRLHCKNLLETEQIEQAKQYIRQFFFSYQNKKIVIY